MSEHSSSPLSVKPPVSFEDDRILDPQQQAGLEQSLRSLPVPKAQDAFQAEVLAAMQSCQDFDPWFRQVATRLRWMALPALFGFVTLWTLSSWNARRLPPPPAPYPIINQGQPAPPLPDLPRLPADPQLSSLMPLPETTLPSTRNFLPVGKRIVTTPRRQPVLAAPGNIEKAAGSAPVSSPQGGTRHGH